MFLDTDTRYTRDLQAWVDATRERTPVNSRPLVAVVSILAAAALINTIVGAVAA